MEAVKLPGDIGFDNFGAGGIKSHAKTPIIQLCTFHERACPKFQRQIRLGDSSPMDRTVGASGSEGGVIIQYFRPRA